MREGFALRMWSEDSSPPNLYPRFKVDNTIDAWTPDPADATLFESIDMAVEKSKLIGGWANLDVIYVKYTDNGRTTTTEILRGINEEGFKKIYNGGSV